jgi:hypothetical protein
MSGHEEVRNEGVLDWLRRRMGLHVHEWESQGTTWHGVGLDRCRTCGFEDLWF